MDQRLLNFYNIELQHLRETAGEFAREYPKIAGRLALDQEAKEVCPDPFVERLIEGFAFLAARVHLKLDAEFPRFTHSILETVYPHYLSPTPSMAVARFEPLRDIGQVEAAFVLPRGSSLKANIPTGEKTACEYRTAQDVEIWPIHLLEGRYYTRDVGQLDLPPGLGARAALRLRLQGPAGMPFKSMKLDRLTFFLRGADDLPVRLFEQIFAHGLGGMVEVRGAEGRKVREVLPPSCLRRVGFRDDEALLPFGSRSFRGYRFLHEYFAMPERFLFFEVSGLAKGVAQAAEDQIDIIIPLKEPETRLENRVNASCFDLFCSPIINLFPKRTDRVPITDRFSEFQVIPDRTRPVDFEVFSIEHVTGFGGTQSEEQAFQPFYLAKDTDSESGAFYSVHRVPRIVSSKERRMGDAGFYTGSEVYLSLVDARCAPYRSTLSQLGVQALCTNRYLPLKMTLGSGDSDFSLQVNAPVKAVRCVSGPTQPRMPFAEGGRAWRMMNHLSLNYLSLLDGPGTEGAAALHDLLKLYADPSDAFVKKQIEGVRSAQASPIVRRAETPGPIAFARGLEVSVLFDEDAFEGTGMFVLGSVLEQFFARYVSLNSFTETVVRSQQRGEIIRWTPQVGRRQLI
jgi:type VI secretion system protein ImpG